MAGRMFKPLSGALEQGVVKLYAQVTTSTSGAVASQLAQGLVVSKTADKVGRYTLTLKDKYMRVLACQAVVIGAADAAYATASGVHAILRNVVVSGAVPALEVQFTRTDTGVDAELANGAVFLVELTLKNSSV